MEANKYARVGDSLVALLWLFYCFFVCFLFYSYNLRYVRAEEVCKRKGVTKIETQEGHYSREGKLWLITSMTLQCFCRDF